MRNSIQSNREHLATGEDFHLQVAHKHVEPLNSIPEYRDFSTKQLLNMIPKKYRAHIPPVGEFFEVRDHAHAQQDKMARAVIIGMLVTEAQFEGHVTMKFLERSFVLEEAK